PSKGVVLLHTITDPVIIPRKHLDPKTGKLIPHMDPDDPSKPHSRTKRVYIGGNNHHVPIRENRNTGKWLGTVVSTFDAAKRVRMQKRDAVDRSDDEHTSFIMSLAEGEMIYARRWDPKKKKATGRADYFVLCKLKSGSSCRIHFAPHWDARKASEQDRWAVTPGHLKQCGPDPATPPYKVWVSPLGEVRRLEKD
ncbi:MAG: hypothetical protein IIB57_09190, partial [Planctomycetes bacterium]|nr:hypothetical protein [Planctomycetota bacterium]